MSKLYMKPGIDGLSDKLIKPDFLDVNPVDPDPDPGDNIGSSIDTGVIDDDDWGTQP